MQPIQSTPRAAPMAALVAMALGLGALPATAAGPAPAVPGATMHHARQILLLARPHPARPAPPAG